MHLEENYALDSKMQIVKMEGTNEVQEERNVPGMSLLDYMKRNSATQRRESIQLIADLPSNDEYDEDGFKRPTSVTGPSSAKNEDIQKNSTDNHPVDSSILNIPLPPLVSPGIGRHYQFEDSKPSPLYLFSPYPPQNQPPATDNFSLEPKVEEQNSVPLSQPSTTVAIPMPIPISDEDNTRKIGSLTVAERRLKLAKYHEKRKRRIWRKKICYDCRKKVADKRLRVKGRFVTREQAFSILGMTPDDLMQNENLINIIKKNAGCSIVTSAQNMRVRNIQTLIMPLEEQKKEISSEFIKQENPNNGLINVSEITVPKRDHVVEIKIDSLMKKTEMRETRKGSDSRVAELPKIYEPVFELQHIELGELSERHKKYHKAEYRK